MASAIDKTLNRVGNAVGDAIESIFSGKRETVISGEKVGNKQTCLEHIGMRLRAEHIEQNLWRRNDVEYSKPLIDAEYNIQTEFKVTSTDDIVEEQKKKAAAIRAKAEKEMSQQGGDRQKVANKKRKNNTNQIDGIPPQAQPEGSVPAQKETTVPPKLQEVTTNGLHTTDVMKYWMNEVEEDIQRLSKPNK